MTDRALIPKAALRKLPTATDDGTPGSPVCRRHGELNRMVPSGSEDSLECEAWSLPTYTDTDRLTYQQMIAGEPCRGCGQELLPSAEPPSWVGKGTLFFTDQEQAAHAAAEEAFQQRHPRCHALQWSMQGSSVIHCARCCPPPPISPGQAQQVWQILLGAAERRIRQAKREGATYDRHELEERLPGRARPLTVVQREYDELRVRVRESVEPEARHLMRSSFPDPELMYRWRMQLGCGDIVEVLTPGADRPVTEVTNASTSAATLRPGALPTTVKNTFRSYATATTVFGLDRTARNSRYASSSATPNRTTRPPAASRDRTNPKPLHAVIQAPLTTRSTSTNMPWITKDYLHIKQIRTREHQRGWHEQ